MSEKSRSERRLWQFPNGLMLAPHPVTDNPYLPPCGDLLQILHDNAANIVDRVQDVFVHSTDLILLDHQHGLFGGGSKVLAGELDELFIPEEEIRNCLYNTRPSLPCGWIEWGNYYFLPALTMPPKARQRFAGLDLREQLEIAYLTKRRFVRSAGGGEQASLPSWSDWWNRFDLDEHTGTQVDLECRNVVTCFDRGAVSSGFWLERAFDRDGVNPLFLDAVDRDKLASVKGEHSPTEPPDPEILKIEEAALQHNGKYYYGSHPTKMP